MIVNSDLAVNILEENRFSLNYLLQILAQNCFTDNHITQSTRGLHSSATETWAQLGLSSFMSTYFTTKSPFKTHKRRENSHRVLEYRRSGAQHYSAENSHRLWKGHKTAIYSECCGPQL